MMIYVTDSTTPTGLPFVASTDIDPTTIVVNGVAYPNASVAADPNNANQAIITITPRSSLSLPSGTSTLTVTGQTLADFGRGTCRLPGHRGDQHRRRRRWRRRRRHRRRGRHPGAPRRRHADRLPEPLRRLVRADDLGDVAVQLRPDPRERRAQPVPAARRLPPTHPGLPRPEGPWPDAERQPPQRHRLRRLDARPQRLHPQPIPQRQVLHLDPLRDWSCRPGSGFSGTRAPATSCPADHRGDSRDQHEPAGARLRRPVRFAFQPFSVGSASARCWTIAASLPDSRSSAGLWS